MQNVRGEKDRSEKGRWEGGEGGMVYHRTQRRSATRPGVYAGLRARRLRPLASQSSLTIKPRGAAVVCTVFIGSGSVRSCRLVPVMPVAARARGGGEPLRVRIQRSRRARHRPTQTRRQTNPIESRPATRTQRHPTGRCAANSPSVGRRAQPVGLLIRQRHAIATAYRQSREPAHTSRPHTAPSLGGHNPPPSSPAK